MSDQETHPPSPPTAPRPSLAGRWWRLPMGERLLVVKLLLLLPVVDLSLRTVGFQRSWAWLARWARADRPALAPDAAAIATAGRVADLARAAGARSPWPTSCLRQALVVWLLLRRRRLPAELKIGVIRREAPFQAHAWVELGGVALDPAAAAHAPFPPLPAPPDQLL